MRKSDPFVPEIELEDHESMRWGERNKQGRLKANFEGLSKCFSSINWKEAMQGKTVQEKYENSFDDQSERVKRYVQWVLHIQ